jgi:hypothetical protein
METPESLGLKGSEAALAFLVSEVQHLREGLTERGESLRRLEEAWRIHDRQEMQRVHALEDRQTAMEAKQITKDDIEKIWQAINALGKADAAQVGGWRLVRELAPWAAVVVAALALAGVGQNRHLINERTSPPPAAHTSP